ncbi:tyrosine-protein phosphatase [Haloferula sp. BvORR071]|uniref:tyrosine-protein phosphatase n=1 Tax=Haloferula sp. BvORR071 TaxID=1396141 RepID=UPI002240F68A|nr:tyrosine-protein phosphatase [Haloferula sp. BvORR071]
MKRKAPFILSLAVGLLLAACSAPANLHRVDVKVWRSSQPQKFQFDALAKDQGIGEVLSLRRFHSDEDKVGRLERHQVRMNAGKIRDRDIVAALRVIASAEKPVLVHCLHGSDRTGVVVAMYRMVVQDWPREKAIAEFTDPQYGYHDGWFPNIREYLETVDVAAIRREVYATGAQ